jgi:hypothetical protein
LVPGLWKFKTFLWACQRRASSLPVGLVTEKSRFGFDWSLVVFDKICNVGLRLLQPIHVCDRHIFSSIGLDHRIVSGHLDMDELIAPFIVAEGSSRDRSSLSALDLWSVSLK